MKVLPSPPAKPFYPENESDRTEIALTAGQLDDLLFPHLGQADLLQKGINLPGRFGAGKPLERRHPHQGGLSGSIGPQKPPDARCEGDGHKKGIDLTKKSLCPSSLKFYQKFVFGKISLFCSAECVHFFMKYLQSTPILNEICCF